MVNSFVAAADKGLDISLDMLVVEAGRRCDAFGDIVEFPMKNRDLRRVRSMLAVYGSALRLGKSACLEKISNS